LYSNSNMCVSLPLVLKQLIKFLSETLLTALAQGLHGTNTVSASLV